MTEREKLINEILSYSSDKFETVEDVIKLAKESKSQLMIRLIHIKGAILRDIQENQITDIRERIENQIWDCF